MKKSEYKEALSAGINEILSTPEVSEEQKIEVVNRMIANLNTDTVNPDHVAHPVIKG